MHFLRPIVCLLIFPWLFSFFGANQVSAAGREKEACESRMDGEVRRRVLLVTGLQATAYGCALAGLYQMWYKDYPRSGFRFHDDLGDWFQMDKLGHVASTYHLSRLSAGSFRLAGACSRRSALYGALSGTAFLTAVEVLDGFSEAWGFSLSDMGANLTGAGGFLLQELFWEEQRIHVKYSYQGNQLHAYRPDLLGSSLAERLIKDYNGMTLWLSFNLHSLLAPGNPFPGWLSLAVGHGASGMLGASQNPEWLNGRPLSQKQRYRQWYLAPDIDFSRIPVRRHLPARLLGAMNFLKMPAPALEYNRRHGWSFHLLFF